MPWRCRFVTLRATEGVLLKVVQLIGGCRRSLCASWGRGLRALPGWLPILIAALLAVARIEPTRVRADDLQAALAPPGTPGPSALAHIRAGKVFWNWCAERGWCRPETIKPVSAPKTGRDDTEISILTPDEAEALLRAAEQHFPQAVPSYAVALFAGVRAEEIAKLEASSVTSEGITLSASITKRGRR